MWLIFLHVEDSQAAILQDALPQMVPLLNCDGIGVNQHVSSILIELAQYGNFS